MAGGLDETCRRIDRAGRADRHEQVRAPQRIVDRVHLIGHFAKEHDVGPQPGLAAAIAYRSGRQRSAPRHRLPARRAQRRSQRAMHVDQPLRPSPFMQVIDILRDDQQFARPRPVERRQRLMRGIGRHIVQLRAPLVIEAMHQRGIARDRFGRADILDAMPFPQSVRPAKGGKPAFGGNPRAGEDDDIAYVRVHVAQPSQCAASTPCSCLSKSLPRPG